MKLPGGAQLPGGYTILLRTSGIILKWKMWHMASTPVHPTCHFSIEQSVKNCLELIPASFVSYDDTSTRITLAYLDGIGT